MGLANNLISRLKAVCSARFDDNYFKEEFIQSYPGCMHFERSDDVMSDIISKVEAYFSPVTEALDKEFTIDTYLAVQPSYENETVLIIFDEKKMIVLVYRRFCVWDLNGMSEDEIANDLLSIYQEAADAIIARSKIEKKVI